MTTLSFDPAAWISNEGLLDGPPAEEDTDVHPDPAPLSFKALTGSGIREIREWLFAACSSSLGRAETLALLHHLSSLEELPPNRFSRRLMLTAAAHMPMNLALTLVRSRFPTSEEALDLEIQADELGCSGSTVATWVDPDSLCREVGDDPERRRTVMNQVRHARLNQVITNRWAMESLLPAIAARRCEGTVVWTVGAPPFPPGLDDRMAVDVALHMDAQGTLRSASRKRRTLAEQLRDLLRQGLRVGCVGNHSTVESRQEFLEVARRMGARSEAIWIEEPAGTVIERNHACGFPVPARTLDRVLETLEAPRPHEAEQVTVVGAGGVRAMWRLSLEDSGGFLEFPNPEASNKEDRG